MLFEMHCHTAEKSKCSSVPAVELIRRVQARGLQGIVLTDHHTIWSEGELNELRHQAGVPDHFLILSAQEVTTRDHGDVLVYGATAALAKGTPLIEIRQDWPRAALVLAHAYRKGRRPTDQQLIDPLLDGVEIFSSNHGVAENSRGLADWHRLRFTAISGTDTHGVQYVGAYPTLFDHPLQSIQELADELRAGRCRPFFKEIPRSGANALVTEVTFGTKEGDENRERIIIRTLTDQNKWKSTERAGTIMAAVAAAGFSDGRYRVPRPIEIDQERMTIIEQGIRGRSLYDKLLAASNEDACWYLELTGRWLGRLHKAALTVTAPEEFRQREEGRIRNYLSRFEMINHRHIGRARQIAEAIIAAEQDCSCSGDCLVQGHGDYHPKNVMIGQDSQEKRETLFVAAIDFGSSLMLPPAFDVGTFLAQFRNQLFGHTEVLDRLPEKIFLDAYLDEGPPAGDDFLWQVELFRARTNLSIAAFLIRVGMGESEDLWRVLVEAEQSMSQI
jgi:aminoglycoside phosphotransferase (APT) family kinase protein/predicted metal-dependent phosphoesterase TrpH